MIIWDIVSLNTPIIMGRGNPREFNSQPFYPCNLRLQGLFFFIYLCVDHRHKQKHTTSSNSFHVSHLNKPMKNSTHKQKHTADQVELHAPHHRPTQKHTANQSELTHLITEKLLQFYNTYFFFIYV